MFLQKTRSGFIAAIFRPFGTQRGHYGAAFRHETTTALTGSLTSLNFEGHTE
jgi:hypothetical protein